MFERVRSGWHVASAIRKLVFKDKDLLLYPVISAIILFITTVAVFVPLVLFKEVTNTGFILAMFLYYILVYFISSFVIASMLIAFRAYNSGKRISVAESFSRASKYFVLLLEWAVFEAVVVMIIRVIEQRLGNVAGLLFNAVASLAMSIAVVFAIPVIIDKKTGPVETIKESTTFIFNNFGKTFGGIIFSDLYSLLFIVSGFVLIIVSTVAMMASLILGAVVLLAGVLLIVFGFMLDYTLSNLFKFVIYDAMNGGKLPEGITKDMIDASIRTKQQKKPRF